MGFLKMIIGLIIAKYMINYIDNNKDTIKNNQYIKKIPLIDLVIDSKSFTQYCLIGLLGILLLLS